MAKAGERIDMPDGSVYVVTTPTADTGDYVEMEFVLPPGCVAPPPHIHPKQAEDYEVLEGSFDVMVEGQWSTLGPGESASVPVGALHTFRNRSEANVRVRNRHTPAERFEEYIERVHTTLETAGIRSKRDPRIPVYLSRVMLEYGDTLYPGRRRERIPMKALAAIGRALNVGGRAH
jgi:mannose-6-phosphate isomerase-like protein (cupin superfamily)